MAFNLLHLFPRFINRYPYRFSIDIPNPPNPQRSRRLRPTGSRVLTAVVFSPPTATESSAYKPPPKAKMAMEHSHGNSTEHSDGHGALRLAQLRDDETVCTGSYVSLIQLYKQLQENSPEFYAFIESKMQDERCGYSSLLRLSRVNECNIPFAKVLKKLLNRFDTNQLRFDLNRQYLQITLEDIFYLTRLPIKGKPVLCRVSPDKDGFRRVFQLDADRVKRTDLKNIVLSNSNVHSNQLKMQVLLFLIIEFLIDPSTAGGRLCPTNVQFVENLNEVGSYAWGAALLCSLYYGFKRNDTEREFRIGLTGNNWITFAFFFLRIPRLRRIFVTDEKFREVPREVPMLVSLHNHFGGCGFDHKLSEDKVALAMNIIDGIQAEDIELRPYQDVILHHLNDVAFARYVGFIFCSVKAYPHKPHLFAPQFEEGAFANVPDIQAQEQVRIRSNRGDSEKNLFQKYDLLVRHWNVANENFGAHGIPHGESSHQHSEFSSVIEPGNNEVSHGASIPSTNEKGKNFVTENDEVDPVKVVNSVLESLEGDNSCTMIVKARYKDEMVKFPFSSNSGIQGLQRELLKRFELESQRIKIKYQDDGEWITLACSEDLGFHMHTLKSSGQTTLDFPQTALNSIQDRIKCFLLSLESLPWMKTGGCLIQFWAPISATSSKHKILSLSDQPFGVGQMTDKLCRYRYYCIQYENTRKDTSEVDPIGRSFARGSPEFCPNIDSYSNEEFPLRNHAKTCGFQGYSALPLFENKQGLCVGVLEILTFTTDISLEMDFGQKIEDAGFAVRWQAPDIGREKYDLMAAVMSPLRDRHNLPLVQVWFPCISEGAQVFFSCDRSSIRVTHWFRGLQLLDWNAESLPFNMWSGHQPYFVEDGRSWIGRAHSDSKVCFMEDISQFSILHYPLVPLTRLSGLTACIAIPLQLLNPCLPPLVLEAFLPQRNRVEDRGLLLKSLLSTLAEQLLRNSVQGFNHTDSFVYYDVHQTRNIAGWLPLGLGKQDHEDRVQHLQVNDSTASNVEIIFEAVQTARFGDTSKATKNHGGGDHLQIELATADDDDDAQSTNEPLREGCSNTGKVAGITRDVVQQHFGKNLEDAAEELGVSRSTLKRKCRSFGIKRWPPHKRNKADRALPMPAAFPDPGDRESSSSSSSHQRKKAARIQKPLAAGNLAVHNYDEAMIVKARYKEDMVKFPFLRSLGIKALRKKLSRRFQLEGVRFRIKYQEDGDWIMISCTQDLNFYMHLLQSLGQNTMNLSLLSDTHA